jgi:hypothetical protein
MIKPLRFFYFACVLLAGITGILQAEIVSAPKLLPGGTFFVLTAPDFGKIRSFTASSSKGQLWNDPVMKPFRSRFMEHFNKSIIAQIESELKMNPIEEFDLLKGQITWAMARPETGTDFDELQWILLMDTKDQAEKLESVYQKILTELRETETPMESKLIRNIQMTSLPPDSTADNQPLHFGRIETIFLAGNSISLIEKILARKDDPSIPSLADSELFNEDYNKRLRGRVAYAWLDFEFIKQELKMEETTPPSTGSVTGLEQMFDPEKLLSVLGISAIRSVSFTMSEKDRGLLMENFINVPELERRGLMRILIGEPKDSIPPGFVSSNVSKFYRGRWDLGNVWSSIENMVTGLNSEMGELLKIVLSTIGKDKDPHFDLKSSFLNNLGDDIISFSKPATSSPSDTDLRTLQNSRLLLVQSRNPTETMKAATILMSLLPPPMNEAEVREFLGRKIYRFNLPKIADSSGRTPSGLNTVEFTTENDYLVASTSISMLEEFLRSNSTETDPLNHLSGIHLAAEKVGGMATGFFGYENNRDNIRIILQKLKEDPDHLLSQLNLIDSIQADVGDGFNLDELKEWCQFEVLPDFQQIEKYFHFMVYSGESTPEGLRFLLFMPHPPGLN